MSSQKVKCPNTKCGKLQPFRPGNDVIYGCSCGRQFDNDPDEGGTYHNRDASRRIEREDEARHQRQKRLGLNR